MKKRYQYQTLLDRQTLNGLATVIALGAVPACIFTIPAGAIIGSIAGGMLPATGIAAGLLWGAGAAAVVTLGALPVIAGIGLVGVAARNVIGFGQNMVSDLFSIFDRKKDKTPTTPQNTPQPIDNTAPNLPNKPATPEFQKAQDIKPKDSAAQPQKPTPKGPKN